MEILTPVENAKAMRQLADWYHEHGFNVLPLGDDKRPVVTGVSSNGRMMRFSWDEWQDKSQTTKLWRQIKAFAWWVDVHGVALICGPVAGLALIDFDDCAPSAEFWQTIGLPEDYPWAYPTPGNGWHVWIRIDGDLQIDKGKLDNPGRNGGSVELRWHGHYGAAPGSLHPNGEYRWRTMPDDGPALVTPVTLTLAYWTDAVAKETPQHNAVASTATTYDGAGSKFGVAALASELDELRGAAAGGRNDALNKAAFALGQLVAGNELDGITVEAALLDVALTLGLSEGEATATIHSGMDSGAQQPRSGKPLESIVDTFYDGFGPMSGQDAPMHRNGNGKAVRGAVTPVAIDVETPTQKRQSTWPYAAHDGRLFFQQEGRDGIKEDCIADFVVRIAEEIIDEDGERTLTLVGSGVRSGAFRCSISGIDFGSDIKLKAVLTNATGGIDPIYKGMTEHVRPAVSKLTMLEERMQYRRYRRVGWKSDEYDGFLMPGRDNDGDLIELPRKLAYSAPDGDASLDMAQQGLFSLLKAIDPQLAAPALAGIFLGPLHRPAGWRNERIGIFIAGRTGSLKTSWVQAALCVFGASFANDDRLVKWGEGATRTAIMLMASHAHDMPLLVDNYKPSTGGGRRDFENLVHNIMEGSDKDRASRNASLRQSQAIHCIPIMTGEDVPSEDAASLARILVIRFEWQSGASNHELSNAQAMAAHLPALGQAWIDWLAGDGRAAVRDIGKQMDAQRDAWAAKLRVHFPQMVNTLRVATNLAINSLTWRAMCMCPALRDVLAPFTEAHTAGLLDIASYMADATSDALEAQQWRAALRELIQSGQYKIIDRAAGIPTGGDSDRVLGWKDSDGVYILPAIALAAVRRLLGPLSIMCSPQTLYGQMAQLRWIASEAKESTTKVIVVGTTKVRILHLSADTLQDDGGNMYNVGTGFVEALGL